MLLVVVAFTPIRCANETEKTVAAGLLEALTLNKLRTIRGEVAISI